MYYWLVVWTPLKNMKVSWDDDIPKIWKVTNPCCKPPTSLSINRQNRCKESRRFLVRRLSCLQSLNSILQPAEPASWLALGMPWECLRIGQKIVASNNLSSGELLIFPDFPDQNGYLIDDCWILGVFITNILRQARGESSKHSLRLQCGTTYSRYGWLLSLSALPAWKVMEIGPKRQH